MEQQPFKRVEQESFTMKPTMQQPWRRQRRRRRQRWGWGTPDTRVYCDRVASHLAQIPREAGQTQALEAVHLVLAAAAVQARRAGALVHVLLAVLAGEAGRAHAPVAVDQVLKREQPGLTSRLCN